MSAVMNYDPNMVMSGNRAEQTIKLTFGDWEYRAEMKVVLRSNVRGADAIEFAIEEAFDQLYDNDAGFATLVMSDAEGNTLTDDQGEDEEWLKDKLIKAEIVDIAPAGRFDEDLPIETEVPA